MKYHINIGWLYPQLMSTYGDRGNILVLQKRCEWRDIATTIIPIDENTIQKNLNAIDIFFGGGAQDREQEIVMKDLLKKQSIIKKKIESEIPALFVCGSPQLFGNYYEPAEGKRIEGLGIFDMITKHPGLTEPRLIGNVVAELLIENIPDFDAIYEITKQSPPLVIARSKNDLPAGKQELSNMSLRVPLSGTKQSNISNLLVGFENHGGRSYLQGQTKPLANIIKGNGNNGKDGTEGMIFKNALGTYLHGPLLPKNPIIADWIIAKALQVKYDRKILLDPLDDVGETYAKKSIFEKLQIS